MVNEKDTRNANSIYFPSFGATDILRSALICSHILNSFPSAINISVEPGRGNTWPPTVYKRVQREIYKHSEALDPEGKISC